MKLHSRLIISGSVSKVILAEAPVSAASDEAPAVDPDAEILAGGIVGDLPHARLEMHGMAIADLHGHVVQMRFAKSIRPPELRMFKHQLRADFPRFACRQGHVLAERHIAVAAFPRRFHRMARFVGKRGAYGNECRGGVEFRRQRFQCGEAGDGVRMQDPNRAVAFEPHVVPDSHVAAADGGDPIPADGGVERRIVCAQHAAIGGATGLRIFFGRTRMGRGIDGDFQQVFVGEQIGDIKRGVGEGALDAADGRAVQRHVGLPVDAVEMQPDALVRRAATPSIR